MLSTLPQAYMEVAQQLLVLLVRMARCATGLQPFADRFADRFKMCYQHCKKALKGASRRFTIFKRL